MRLKKLLITVIMALIIALSIIPTAFAVSGQGPVLQTYPTNPWVSGIDTTPVDKPYYILFKEGTTTCLWYFSTNTVYIDRVSGDIKNKSGTTYWSMSNYNSPNWGAVNEASTATANAIIYNGSFVMGSTNFLEANFNVLDQNGAVLYYAYDALHLSPQTMDSLIYGIDITTPTEGFKDTSPIFNTSVRYKVPFNPNTQNVEDIVVEMYWNGGALGEPKQITMNQTQIGDGYVIGMINVSGTPPAGDFTITAKVTDAYGIAWNAVPVHATRYTDFVDTNADGLDDRTGFEATHPIEPPAQPDNIFGSLQWLAAQLQQGVQVLNSVMQTITQVFSAIMQMIGTAFTWIPSQWLVIGTVSLAIGMLMKIVGR